MMKAKDITKLLHLVELKVQSDAQELTNMLKSQASQNSQANALQAQAYRLRHEEIEPPSAAALVHLEKHRQQLFALKIRKDQNADAMDPMITHLRSKVKRSKLSEMVLKTQLKEHTNKMRRTVLNKEEEAREQLQVLKR